jgi:hypothetical protein
LESIYAHIDELSPKIAEKLRVGQLQGNESKQLVSLIDIPTLQRNTVSQYDREPPFNQFNDVLVEQYHMHSLE